MNNITQLSQWENDKIVPSAQWLPKLASVYGVTTDLILIGTADHEVSNIVPRGTSATLSPQEVKRLTRAFTEHAETIRRRHTDGASADEMKRLDAEWDIIIRNGIASGALTGDPTIERVIRALKAGEAPEVYGPPREQQQPVRRKAARRKNHE